MKHFNIPYAYKNSFVKTIRNHRSNIDKLKKDLTPTCIDMGLIKFYLPRNFGFCFGVENAISICNDIIDNNKSNKRIFLLSELIHNPIVNEDLVNRGVKFLMHNDGKQIIPFSNLTSDDIVIIPAFGTTIEIENELKNIGIDIKKYYSTCPFVEKVWRKGQQLIDENYTIIIHGKPEHEETKATFSQVTNNQNPCIVIRDKNEAILLAKYIKGEKEPEQFFLDFKNKHTPNFNPKIHLRKIGVINQTTMLANETKDIAAYFKQVLIDHFKIQNSEIKKHFSDTNDTLCYATNENQIAVKHLVQHQPLDVVIVIGGINSSNTFNLYKIANKKVPTFFITSEKDILNKEEFNSYDVDLKITKLNKINLPAIPQIGIIIGASCPDSQIDAVITKLMFLNNESVETTLNKLNDIAEHYSNI